jgi:hypothetical protein
MSEQFYYSHFRLSAKNKDLRSVTRDPEVMLEVPRRLVEDWKRENPDQDLSDEAIAGDIARVIAVKTALLSERHAEYECDAPNWYDRRPPLMNERACDHHDNGIRAWLIK